MLILGLQGKLSQALWGPAPSEKNLGFGVPKQPSTAWQVSNTFFKNHSTLVRNPEMPLPPPEPAILNFVIAFRIPAFPTENFCFQLPKLFSLALVFQILFHILASWSWAWKIVRFPKTDGCSVPFPHSHATTPTTGKPLTNLLAVNPLCGRVCVCGGGGRDGLRVTSFRHTPHTPHPPPQPPLFSSKHNKLSIWHQRAHTIL